MKKVSQWNYKPKKGKKFPEPSLTEPGQVSSIREIVEKHGAGIPPLTDSRLEWADAEEMMPKFNDLTDIDESKRFVASVKAKINKAIKSAEAEDKEQQAEEEAALALKFEKKEPVEKEEDTKEKK